MHLLIVETKQTLRTQMLKARDALPLAQREQAAHEMMTRALSFLATLPTFHTVAGYGPIRSEIDPLALMNSLIVQGKTLALPVITIEKLIFRQWGLRTPLLTRKWGLREPDAAQAIIDPQVLLVPLVGFDDNLNRLGYGKGYYDQALSELREKHTVFAVGLAYEIQKTFLIPVEEHDQPLDAVITDQAIYTS